MGYKPLTIPRSKTQGGSETRPGLVANLLLQFILRQRIQMMCKGSNFGIPFTLMVNIILQMIIIPMDICYVYDCLPVNVEKVVENRLFC